MMNKDFEQLFKTIDNSNSISELFELDAIPPINYASDFFFVSYSHTDYKIIYKDIFQYQKEGVSVWFDRGMKPGTDWLENAEHFISQFACKGIIIYLSKTSLHSRAVLEEIFLANAYRKPLMPIVIDANELIDNDIAKTLINNFSLSDEEQNIINKSFSERTLWVDNSFPIKSKLNYIKNLEDETSLLEIVDLNEDNSPILLGSHGYIKGKMITQINDPYCMRVKIPLDIKCIGNATFTNMANLKEVDLSNILEIDDYAFSDAKQLKEVNLEKAIYIGDSAFERCSSLEHIVFPSKKTLQQLFDDYDSIDLNASYEDENGEFDEEALSSDFDELKNDWFVDDNSAYGEGQRIIPDMDDYHIDSHYGKNIFAHCNNLKEIVLENTFNEIPEGCFHDCKGLERVVFNGPNHIGKRAFYNCENLKEIIFPDEDNNIDKFGDDDALDFLGLKNNYSESQRALYLDKKVTEIGDYAFEGCKSLEFFEFPLELKRIGKGAFKNASIKNDYAYIDFEVGEQAFMGSTIGKLSFAGVRDIPDELCRGCKNLSGLNLNLFEHSIGASAFRECPNLGTTFVGCKEIMKSAFSHSGITTLILDKNVTHVREYAFSTCEKMETVEIRCENVHFAPAAFYKDKIKYLYISKESHIVFDPLSLEETEIEKIYYQGDLDDVGENKLSIEIDYVDDPNTTQAFICEEDEINYHKEREERLQEAKQELLPMIASKIVFYSSTPIYDGRHWRYKGREAVIWEEI